MVGKKIQKLQDDSGKYKEVNQLDNLIVNYFQSMLSTLGLDGNMDFLESLRG